MNMIKALVKYYSIEILLVLISIVLFVLVYKYGNASIPIGDFVNMFVRKTFLFGTGLTLAYIIRRIKVGIIDWKEKNAEHWYAIALLIYTGLIFGFG